MVSLSHKESDQLFGIMEALSAPLEFDEVRISVGRHLMALLGADYFASYVWDESTNCFVNGLNINMSQSNLAQYEAYYQYSDPITPTLSCRRGATAVSAVMAHERLRKTEFFCDFLQKDGLCYGLNFFARDQGKHVGDLRIWRSSKTEDFGPREIAIINALGSSFVNALVRAKSIECGEDIHRFSYQRGRWELTRREAEIADLLIKGLSDLELCGSLGTSKPTLRSHISSIFQKTGVKNRASLYRELLQKNHY